MNLRRALLLAAACAACGETDQPTAITTEQVWHLERGMPTVEGELGPAAASYLGDQLGLPGEEDFAVLSEVTGADTLRHVRLQQRHRGVPVLGAEVIVHADDTTFLGYGGAVTRGLDGVPVEPAIDGEQARAIAREHLAAAGEPTRTADRLVLVARDGTAQLVRQVELLVPGGDGAAPGRWFYQVDARSGAVLDRFDGLTTEQASGPGGNPKVARSWQGALDVEEAGGEYAMETRRLITVDMKGEKDGGEVVRGPLEPIGDAAINDAHGYAEITLAMMREWMGQDSINGKGFPIRSRVHYDDNLANAFWDGEQMTYGDGGDHFYPLSGGLDVVAHEISHGFTENHSDLRYSGQSGGLNESFSDIAGALVEYYDGDPGGAFLIGEDVRREGVALRFMCDPQTDGHSIDHTLDLDEASDVHYTSGIGNKAFCLAVARTEAAGGSQEDAVRTMGQVWYLANAGYWTSEADYSVACRGTLDAARALGLDDELVAGLQQSWADVGAYCDSGLEVACEADGVCDGGDGETCYSCATDCGSCTEPCSWWKQFKCQLGIGDCERCAVGEPCGDGVCSGDETDETCGQDCGCRSTDDSCGRLAPYGCWCDDECDENGDCCADVGICP